MSVTHGLFAQQRIIRVQNENGQPVVNAQILADARPLIPIIEGKTNTSGEFTISFNGAFKLSIISPTDSMIDFEGTYTAMDHEIMVILKQKNI